MKNNKIIANIVKYAVLLLYTVIALFPLYWLVTTSFKPPLEVFSTQPLGTFVPSFENYKVVLFNDMFPKYLWNSVIISLITVLITLPVGSLAGYAFARFKIKNKDNWFFMVLTTRMAPPVAFAVPLYLLMVRFGLVDTYVGLIAIYIFMNLAFCIWLTRGFFEEIPPDVEEAAMIDGCSRLQAFWKVTVPLTAGGLIATGVLMFIFTWNEFFFASILTQSIAKPFTVHLTSFFGSKRILWGELAAASTIGSLIPIIFAIVMRRYLVRGLTMGAVK
ncbi:carbohydrate ABC transporter permease [Thermincola potens]|uniref:Binding-protein-dependent transport systems inner membrane component n=1 Tax=Thermincola potens (strain JR) TaxID=635013 RepID=D5X9X1_THEPJ|nr:carbohydrate ABC transporter permease [Thermincola potens]ADG83104.1 binding-protein-dependent transport systems inner membrane component [Thermincola potens JR]